MIKDYLPDIGNLFWGAFLASLMIFLAGIFGLKDFYENNVGGYITPITKAIILSSLFFLILFILLINWYLPSKKKHPNPWTWISVAIMACLLFSGTSIISDLVGQKNLDLVLREGPGNGDIQGNIHCEGTFIEGSMVECTETPKLENKSWVINQELNYTDNRMTQNHGIIYFRAWEDVTRIDFHINGIDENNNYREFKVGHDFSFLTKEEETKNEDRRITFILGLIAVIFISVPSMMNNFKNLSQRTKK